MKLSLKSSSLFAAVAMSIYSAFIIIAQTPLYDNVILSVDKYFVLSYVCTSLLLVSMLVLGISIFINRKQIPVLSKSLLWQTRVITAVLCFMLFCNIFSIASVYINGMLYFWWHGFEWLRYVMLFLVTAWLWQFAYMKPQEYISAKHLGNCGLAVSIGIGIVLLLMLISFVHVLVTGHVAGFRTNVFVSWLKPISVVLLLITYLSERRHLYKQNRQSSIRKKLSNKTNNTLIKNSKTMKKIFIVLALVLTCSTMFAKQPQRPNSYNYQRGVEALVEGEVATGIDYLNKELEENPKNGYAHSWIAAARASQSEYGAALTAVNKAMQYIPKKDAEYTSWAYSMRANIYLELEDTVAALKDFNQAIKIDPSNEDYFESRADILFNQGNYDEANKDYQHIISLNPGSVIGYMGLGRNLKEQGEYEKAIELFSYVIKIHPEYSSGYSFRAEVYLKQKRYNEATDDILTALDIDEDRKAYYLLITEYTDPTTLNLLKGKFQIKKTKEPNNVYWSYYYGLVLEKNRLFRDAIEQYQTCKRINASTLFDEQIAYCYSKMGDFERALEYVNYAIAVDSTDADYYEQRANIYGEMGNRAKAIEDLTKYIEFYPEYSYAYYRRGWYKHLDLQHEAAIEDFNLSIMLDSTYNYAYDGRGRSYVALGKTDLAKADFEKILSFDTIPNDNSCASSAYHFLGQDSLAIDFMRRTLKEDSTAYYDAACTFALAGQTDSAVFYLRKAFENGFVRLHHISVDMDFDAIRQDERFKAVVEEYTLKIQQANSSEDNAQSNEERIVEVPFTAANGVTKVNCTINGLPLNFVFDTGASDVTISQVEANFMFKNGYLSEKDIVGKQHYQTADGNISVGTVINLNSINFGGLSLNNIRASVVQSQNAPLLLGQSVLQRLGKIEIDNSQRILKITTKQ